MRIPASTHSRQHGGTQGRCFLDMRHIDPPFKDGSENMDLTVASFDDPSPYLPKHHFGAESMHRAWVNTEGLPECRTENYQKLVDKWVEATGQFPG